MRLRFILGLVLLGIALQFIAKTLNGVLPMMREAAQYPVSRQMMQRTAQYPPRTASFDFNFISPATRFTQSVQHLKKQLTRETSIKLINPADPGQSSSQNGNAFMQITLEDIRPPVKNAALGAQASARLEMFLMQRREENSRLAQETETLFGKDAQREVIKVFAIDERDSLANAREAQSAADFASRQEKTDQKTTAALAAIFEKYKKQFNRRLKKHTPAWNEFFQKVNAFKKAGD